MSTIPIYIVWFRQDLRLSDNPALDYAVRQGQVLPIYIFESNLEWQHGGASQWWLNQSLRELNAQLEALGSQLHFFRGEAEAIIPQLIQTTQAAGIVWNRRYEPQGIEIDRRLKDALKQVALETKSFNASLIFEPWQVVKDDGTPYKVFTPFYKSAMSRKLPLNTVPTPSQINSPKLDSEELESVSLEHLKLMPNIKWYKAMAAEWTPGEAGARERLAETIDTVLEEYKEGRNWPDKPFTSKLSPHLHFGEISPRVLWQELSDLEAASDSAEFKQGTTSYLREIMWREFGYYTLYHFPHTTKKSLREDFDAFNWNENAEELYAWQKGLTGYPIVDAGMRELWALGWMHNRVRMVVASFLVKDLLFPWQAGAAWFWDTLVDADLANNTLGWQWAAGCGVDAAPYFRVFNPILQGKKFDPDGEYVKKWIPELANLPKKWIHEPWNAPQEILKTANVALGQTYPEPIVDHSFARDRFLALFKS